MSKFSSYLMMAAGFQLFAISVFQEYFYQQGTELNLVKAEQLVIQQEEEPKEPKKADFDPEPNETIGILKIPKLDYELPIIEGTDEEMLAKGVGHFKSTAFPGEGEQILLSGHRDTVFRRFNELKNNDIFIVELPYGTFKYKMADAKIVDADDRTVIRKMGEEVLVLSTCYPFTFIGDAPDRYVIYAYPIP